MGFLMNSSISMDSEKVALCILAILALAVKLFSQRDH